VERVTLAYTVQSLGHKAFFGCNKLSHVIFTSFDAPNLEEEFDATYFESLEHIPGTGDYGTYTDWAGNEVKIEPMNLVPYFMWNVTGGMYSNVFYGANFVDYVGYVTDKLMLVHPVNGQHYDSFIMNQYFDLTVAGAAAADDITLAAIEAINEIPERVVYEHKAIVEAARAAYNKIATTGQQALVTNYDKLLQAEQRILALTPEEDPPAADVEEPTSDWSLIAVIAVCVIVLIGGGVTAYILLHKRKTAAANPSVPEETDSVGAEEKEDESSEE
jgi:hypothetical protein